MQTCRRLRRRRKRGKEKKAPPHRDGLTFLSFTPHSLARSLTSAHQVGDSDDGKRDAVVPQSHRRPRYSPASDLFRGIPLPRRYHGDMNPQVHSSDGTFSVSVSAGCARTYVCRLCGRARTVASVCVLLVLLLFFFFKAGRSKDVTAVDVHKAIVPLSHTQPLLPSHLWMTASHGRAGLSWLLFIVNIFKKISSEGGLCGASGQLQGA